MHRARALLDRTGMIYCPAFPPDMARRLFLVVLPSPMDRETNDAARLRSLDPTDVGVLHDQVFPELYRYAQFRLGDPHLAEDTASEAFLRLLEAVQAGRGPRSSPRGWLFGTLRHIVDDHFRVRYGRPMEISTDEVHIPEGGPAEAFERKEKQDAIRAALRRLTPDQQHVLALRFGDEHSLEETAALTGRNANAVKALQFRALQALRRALQGEEPE